MKFKLSVSQGAAWRAIYADIGRLHFAIGIDPTIGFKPRCEAFLVIGHRQYRVKLWHWRRWYLLDGRRRYHKNRRAA